MRTKIITIGILTMIAICATVAMAADDTEIYMTHDTLNLNSGEKYVTAFLNESDLGEIEPDELILTDDPSNGNFNISAEKVSDDPDNGYDYAVKFSREDVINGLDEETETIRLYVVHKDSSSNVDFIVGFDDFIVKNSN